MPVERLHITGRRPLLGEVSVSGSKNAALGMLAASLLSETLVRLAGVPELGDVRSMRTLLQSLGVDIAVSSSNEWRIDPARMHRQEVGDALARQFRASICVLGPLLATQGRGCVALPGGCNLGHRPIDLHLHGLRAMGANIRIEHGRIIAEASRLRGARIDLAGSFGPTVTGTCNVMAAAVRAKGESVIAGAAREPEVVACGRLLQAMGAKITGLGSSTLRIEGVSRLAFPAGAIRPVPPDRIEAATLMIAAAACPQSDVELRGAPADQLRSVIELIREYGSDVRTTEQGIRLRAPAHGKPFQFSAKPYPGLPTDLQPLLLALAAGSQGASRIRDRVFPHRWMHVAELARLGANVELRGDTATVTGNRLQGAKVQATDLRAAAALVVAGLAAEGETVVESLGHLDRGYERLDKKLAALGADIERRACGRIDVVHSCSPRNSGCPSTFLADVIGPRKASSRSTR